MKRIDELDREYRLLDFNQLVFLRYTGPHETTWDVEECAVEMVLRTEPGDRRLTIECIGVEGFSLRDLGGGVTQIAGLAVDDLRQAGMEKINWKIHDLENGRIEILCKSARGRVDEGW